MYIVPFCTKSRIDYGKYTKQHPKSASPSSASQPPVLVVLKHYNACNACAFDDIFIDRLDFVMIFAGVVDFVVAGGDTAFLIPRFIYAFVGFGVGGCCAGVVGAGGG